MKNITLALDERVIAAGREYAARHHTTLNQRVRDRLEQTATRRRGAAVDAFLRSAELHAGDSAGWKWNREEIQPPSEKPKIHVPAAGG